jgi:hypothetical protein
LPRLHNLPGQHCKLFHAASRNAQLPRQGEEG